MAVWLMIPRVAEMEVLLELAMVTRWDTVLEVLMVIDLEPYSGNYLDPMVSMYSA